MESNQKQVGYLILFPTRRMKNITEGFFLCGKHVFASLLSGLLHWDLQSTIFFPSKWVPPFQELSLCSSQNGYAAQNAMRWGSIAYAPSKSFCSGRKTFYNLVIDKLPSTYAPCHARSIQLEGYWLLWQQRASALLLNYASQAAPSTRAAWPPSVEINSTTHRGSL